MEIRATRRLRALGQRAVSKRRQTRGRPLRHPLDAEQRPVAWSGRLHASHWHGQLRATVRWRLGQLRTRQRESRDLPGYVSSNQPIGYAWWSPELRRRLLVQRRFKAPPTFPARNGKFRNRRVSPVSSTSKTPSRHHSPFAAPQHRLPSTNHQPRSAMSARHRQSRDRQPMIQSNYELAYRMQSARAAGTPRPLRRIKGDSRRRYGVEPQRRADTSDKNGFQGSYARNCLLARRMVEARRPLRHRSSLSNEWDQHSNLDRPSSRKKLTQDFRPARSPHSSKTSRNAASSTTPSSSGAASLAGPRLSRAPTAAITTRKASPCGWPAAV